MGYKDFVSKPEDIVWLAYQLKNQLGDKISINKFGLYKEVLEGRYNLDGYDRGIDFEVLYSDKEFLSVGVGELYSWAKYEDKLFVLNELKTAIGNIVRDGVSLGEPTIFYNIKTGEHMAPNLEYVYADKNKAIKAFKDGTVFDDGDVPENVIVFKKQMEINNAIEQIEVFRNYSYMVPGSSNEYSISIYSMLENKSDIEKNDLKDVLIDNLDELFNGNNLLSKYLTYNNDISYITAYIKNALSLAEELELNIVIKKDGNEIHNIRYVNDHFVEYKSCSKIFEYNLNTYYDVVNGIRFDTNCVLGASDVIEKGISMELKKINALRDNNIRGKVKSNNNLLKLVRRIGNR